jgi:hypothetical protein
MTALLRVVKLDALCIALTGYMVLVLAGAETRGSAGAVWMVKDVDGFS